ncbi:AIF_HP2_G0052570.mRNA.1.CDS.1 [Saccharomyces cerevisiae]|nr:AIF_HP2_G0052570.mRNA.1.CDS.1 [Saccharomyces cerevisiae]CAI6799779.1 AIF_HP2_G0052570.mRNA.1.CDS.1 [Saccharomyces cerevisiae]
MGMLLVYGKRGEALRQQRIFLDTGYFQKPPISTTLRYKKDEQICIDYSGVLDLPTVKRRAFWPTVGFLIVLVKDVNQNCNLSISASSTQIY